MVAKTEKPWERNIPLLELSQPAAMALIIALSFPEIAKACLDFALSYDQTGLNKLLLSTAGIASGEDLSQRFYAATLFFSFYYYEHLPTLRSLILQAAQYSFQKLR